MNTNVLYMNKKRLRPGLKSAASSPRFMAVNADQLAGLNALKNDPNVVAMMNNEPQEIIQDATVVNMPAAAEMPKEENLMEQPQAAAPAQEVTPQENVIQNTVEPQAVVDMSQTPPAPNVVPEMNGDTVMNNPVVQEPIQDTPVVNENVTPAVNISAPNAVIDNTAPTMENTPAVDVNMTAVNEINNANIMENSSAVPSSTTNVGTDEEYREQMAANAELQRKVQEIFDTAKREAMAAIGDFLEKNSKKKMNNNSVNLTPKKAETPAIDLGTNSVIQMPTPEVNVNANTQVPSMPSVAPEMSNANNGITENAAIQNETPVIDLQSMKMVPNAPITPPQSMGEVQGQIEEQNGPVLTRAA